MRATFCLLLLLTACGEEATDSADTSDDTSDTSEEVDRPLKGGEWLTTDLGLHDDTCGTLIASTGFEGGPMRMSWNDDGTFYFHETPPRTCTIDGDTFSCTPEQSEFSVPWAHDTTLLFVSKPLPPHTIISPTEIYEEAQLQFDCAGTDADCATVEEEEGTTFPCTIAAAADSVWRGP